MLSKKNVKRIFSLLVSALIVLSTVTFTGFAEDDLFSIDFKGKTKDDVYVIPHISFEWGGGAFNKTDDGFCISAGTGGSANSYLEYYRKSDDPFNLTGNITLEARIKLGTVDTSDVYYPLTIVADGGATDGHSAWGLSKLLFVKNGKWYCNATTTAMEEWESAETVICEAKSDTFYTIKLNLNVDGDASTLDTYTYELKDESAGTVYKPETKYYIGGTYGGGSSAYNNYNLTKIYGIIIGRIITSSSTSSITLDYVKGYEAKTPVVTCSFENGAELAAGTAVTLSFSEEMDTATFENIKLLKGGTDVISIEPAATDEKTCIITLPELENTSYSLVIPETVVSAAGKAVSETVFGFIGAATQEIPSDTDLFSIDFKGKTKDDVYVIPHISFEWGGGEFNKTDDGFCISAGTSGSTNSYLEYYKSDDPMNLKGNIALEARIKLGTVDTSDIYYPLTIVADGGATDGSAAWGLSKLLFVKNGKWYCNATTTEMEEWESAETVICEAKSDTFYTIKLNLNVDGDSSTLDTYTYELKDESAGTVYKPETKYYIGGTYGGGSSAYNNYNLTKIYGIIIGRIITSSSTSSITLDYVKGTKLTAPAVVSSTPASGAKDVELDSAVAITFSHPMKEESLSAIVLKNGTAAVETTGSYNAETKTYTLTAVGGLDYSVNYVVEIPSSVSGENGVSISKTNIVFRTKAEPTPFEVSEVKVNGEGSLSALPKDEELVVTAIFTNKSGSSSQKAALIAAVYDSDGIMKKIAYTNETLTTSEPKSVTATFGAYRAAAGDYIKVFAWDDFSTMVPMSGAVRFPAK